MIKSNIWPQNQTGYRASLKTFALLLFISIKSSALADANDEPYLFDFGAGVVRRAAALSPRFGGKIPALDAKRLKTAFLTHLHSDHTLGLPDLILSGWTSGRRKQALNLYGPEGTKELVDGIEQGWEEDIKYRVFGQEGANNQGWRTNVTEIKEGEVYRDKNIRVIAFPVIHGSWPNAYGYRVETADKVIVISGDLSPSEKIRTYSKDADLLIHEVYCERGFKESRMLTDELRLYHRKNHTSTLELAKLAAEVQPTDNYKGKVILANDLDIYQ